MYLAFVNFKKIILVYERFKRKIENHHDTDLYAELIIYFCLLIMLVRG